MSKYASNPQVNNNEVWNEIADIAIKQEFTLAEWERKKAILYVALAEIFEKLTQEKRDKVIAYAKTIAEKGGAA